ncbi:receptor-type guanylate cyclase Gyc76C-like isoform X1 [Vespula squamosa]|uniref:Receptor-type guanylate cyclase Gyc76C-like isoform X1 n=1 Tax=Vespula squamosa TaxID=30214 RepID=A0ABD2ADB5_VESSQ
MRPGPLIQPSRRRPPRRQHQVPHRLHRISQHQQQHRRQRHRQHPRSCSCHQDEQQQRQQQQQQRRRQKQRQQQQQQEDQHHHRHNHHHYHYYYYHRNHHRQQERQRAGGRRRDFQRGHLLSSRKSFLVLLLLASSPLVLGLAEPSSTLEWQRRTSYTSYSPSSSHSDGSSKQVFDRNAIDRNIIFGSDSQTRMPLNKSQNLTIGYLTAIKGGLKDRQGLAISGALSMALDEINNDPNILPNVRLQMRWSDTRGETVEATKAMIDMICDGVTAFFGPEGSCYVEAIVAQSRNIPMISYSLLKVITE